LANQAAEQTRSGRGMPTIREPSKQDGDDGPPMVPQRGRQQAVRKPFEKVGERSTANQRKVSHD